MNGKHVYCTMCVGMFLNGRRDKLQKEKIAMPAVQKLWNKSKAASNYPGMK